MRSSELLGTRCTFVIGAAGYGKTTALRRLLHGQAVTWLSGVSPAALTDLGAAAGTNDWIVLDDLPGFSSADLDMFSRGLGLLPQDTRLVLVSRLPPATIPRWACAPVVRFLGPAELASSADQSLRILRDEYGVRDAETLRRLHTSTGGWPALLHLAGAQLSAMSMDAGRAPAGELAVPGTAIAAFVEKEVLDPLGPVTRRLVRDLACLGPISADLCSTLGHTDRGAGLSLLRHTGLVSLIDPPAVPARAWPDSRLYRLVPLVAEVARSYWPLPEGDRERLCGVAADWYERAGLGVEAIAVLVGTARHADTARLLHEQGTRAVTAGAATTVVAAIRALPYEHLSREILLLLGVALTVSGEYDEAVGTLAGLTQANEPLKPDVAWRLGAAHYLSAQPQLANQVFAQVELGQEQTFDEAMVLASHAISHWLVGDKATCDNLARRALRASAIAGEPSARAAAHVAMALAAELAGDPRANAEHYERALTFARDAGDLVQAARIHTNRAGMLLDEARYPEALRESLHAVGLADELGALGFLPVALSNAGEALTYLGRLQEAIAHFERALSIYQRDGSDMVVYPLIGLGGVYRWQGQWQLARATYEEAIEAANRTGNLQGLVPALSGLALTVCRENPAIAAETAARAVDAASGRRAGRAWIAYAWVLAGAGETDQAVRAVAKAAELAGRHRDRACAAEALEIQAAVATDPAQARRALEEAAATWRLTGATLHVDRIQVLRGKLPDAGVAERVEARLIAERLASAGQLSTRDGSTTGSDLVVIRTLGRFEVSVGGLPLPLSAWQSRKARDLLRILVARRGRGVNREELAELLWPEGDPGRVGHRLSVALSVLRSVLDPARQRATDHFVLGGSGSIALDMTRISLDVEDFLAEAEYGMRLRDHGRPAEARSALASAERRYSGDFLEEEPYEDWTTPTRETARATYMRVVRALAELASRAGEIDETVHWFQRLLERDPYDEQSHLALISALDRAGRYGEAQRARSRYSTAMRTVGVEPA